MKLKLSHVANSVVGILAAGFIGAASAAGPEIIVLSNRADLISGGDALVQIKLPAGSNPAFLKINVDGRSVRDSFAFLPDGSLGGLVTGLKIGVNTLRAVLPSGRATIPITNHDIGGPVFSGTQVDQWVCNTKVANPTLNNPDLGDPIDAKCNIAEPKYYYRYRNTSNQFVNYDPASPPAPNLISTTTTDEGKVVPFIYRVERGVMNRGKYDIAYLANPADPTAGWSPFAKVDNWNRKLFISFGSGCEYGRSQVNPGGVSTDALSKGFMVAQSEMILYGNHCNDVTSSETVMMLKERITEQYGPILFTMSNGSSGGAHQQNLTVSNYPGLLQGIMPGQNFQDTWTPGREFADCGLLTAYNSGYATDPTRYPNPAGVPQMTINERGHVYGHRYNQICEGPASINMASRTPFYMDPQVGDAGCGTHPNRWSPTNLTGIRCTLQDFNIAVFGPRDATGYAKTPQDNVGVQYGFNALNEGVITTAQFLKLNEQIGGYDINGQWQPARMVADPDAARITWTSGRISNGKGLGEVAIIDARGYDDTEEHYDFRTWVSRNRILREWGDYANQVIWRTKGGGTTGRSSFDVMNEWLTAAVNDTTPGRTWRQKIIANKPVEAVDRCFRTTAPVGWTTDVNYCNLSANPNMNASLTGSGATLIPVATADEWPVWRDTRVASGEPLTSDIMKCQLKAPSRSDYTVTFSDAEWARLLAAFPAGVCDYSKPGMFQDTVRVPWQTFEDGPGGRPLGNAPASVATIP